MHYFGIDFGSILAPKMPPFVIIWALKIDQKNNPKSDCLQGRSKIAPRAPKTLPRRPPDPPGEPQTPPRGLPDPPRTPPDALPDPSGRPTMFSETSGPMIFFGKIEKAELVEKKSTKKNDNGHPQWSLAKGFSEAPGPKYVFGKFEKINPIFFPKELFVQRSSEKSKNSKSSKRCRKKIDNGHPRWSLHTIPHKNRKPFHTGRTQRVAAVDARSALTIRRPLRSTARRVVAPP